MSKTTTTANSNDLVRLYQSIDEHGEITSKYKYLPGSPKNYRFDGRTGDFNLGGVKQLGKKLSIQPIAFRFMEDELFARKSDITGEMKRELWTEVFFVDEKNAVSYIMFNNGSARNLQKLIESLFYEDVEENGSLRSMELMDVVLTISGEKKENDKGKYFLVNFEFEVADSSKVLEYRQLCEDVQVFSRDTITQTAEMGLCSNSYPVACLPVVDDYSKMLDHHQQ
jgi:hypothetical protein